MATKDYHIDLSGINKIHGAIQSIRIGTVTTLAAGTNPTVSVTVQGDPPEAVFNFSIPRGATGPSGTSYSCWNHP